MSPPYRDGGYRPAGDGPSTGQPKTQPQTGGRRAVAKSDSMPEPEAAPRRGKRIAVFIGLLVVAIVGAGVWAAANPSIVAGLPSFSAITAGLSSSPTAKIDAQWQRTAYWPVIKREFPDWYGDRLRDAAKLTGENKPEDEINKALVDQLIALRRENSAQALAASAPKLRLLAQSFLDNLRFLKSQSTQTCFNFISQGESTPGVIEQFQALDGSAAPLQNQVAAIFDAIGEGRKAPVTHSKPVKADYDVLMEQLAKLGWTQADVATFADPKALARTEPARVCQMVQDWFVAHIAISDEAAQERLLGETLRPVVSG